MRRAALRRRAGSTRRRRVHPRLVNLLRDTNVLVAALIARGGHSDPDAEQTTNRSHYPLVRKQP
jgi:hypothetical protein